MSASMNLTEAEIGLVELLREQRLQEGDYFFILIEASSGNWRIQHMGGHDAVHDQDSVSLETNKVGEGPTLDAAWGDRGDMPFVTDPEAQGEQILDFLKHGKSRRQ